jgi:hypothetical protein
MAGLKAFASARNGYQVIKFSGYQVRGRRAVSDNLKT